jgi:hypothetical protein
MGQYGRQWEEPVNLWNNLEISVSVGKEDSLKLRFFNKLGGLSEEQNEA